MLFSFGAVLLLPSEFRTVLEMICCDVSAPRSCLLVVDSARKINMRLSAWMVAVGECCGQVAAGVKVGVTPARSYLPRWLITTAGGYTRVTANKGMGI